tara:strand:+ start:366 stop:968 length:603 start_codon:yes stop_codon:yes gene_type:complete
MSRKMGIQSSSDRYARAATRGTHAQSSKRTINLKRDLKLQEQGSNYDFLNKVIESVPKVIGISQDYRHARKQDKKVDEGKSMYNQLLGTEVEGVKQDAYRDETITWKNRKEKGKGFFDIGKTISYDIKSGEEIKRGDFLNLHNFVSSKEKYTPLLEALGIGEFDDKGNPVNKAWDDIMTKAETESEESKEDYTLKDFLFK